MSAVKTYKKKPTPVEAVQWDGSMGMGKAIARWSDDRIIVVVFPDRLGYATDDYSLKVLTAHGPVPASRGAWVVRQRLPDGTWDYWPVTAEIFAATYDPA